MENIIDLIYAYSLGCLDHEEQQLVIDYLNNDEPVKLPILGEFQNLTALLPSILTKENPDPQLKDIVAKRLYHLNDEIMGQRQESISTTKVHEEAGEELNSSDIEKADEKAKQNDNQNNIDDLMFKVPDFFMTPNDLQITEKEQSNFSESNHPEKIVQEETGIDSLAQESEIFTAENSLPDSSKTGKIHNKAVDGGGPPKKKSYKMMIWGGAVTILIITGTFVLYFIMSSKTNNVYKEVERLKKQVGILNNQLNSAQEIQKILQSPDVQVINLRGTIINQIGSGKLFIRTEKGAGYIQFSQMPSLPEDKSFQLWIKVPGKVSSLGILQASDNMGFYSFKLQILPKADIINFLITEEPKTGSATPGNKVYLTGKLIF